MKSYVFESSDERFIFTFNSRFMILDDDTASGKTYSELRLCEITDGGIVTSGASKATIYALGTNIISVDDIDYTDEDTIIVIDELALNSTGGALTSKEYRQTKNKLLLNCISGMCKLILISREKPRTNIPYGFNDIFALHQSFDEVNGAHVYRTQNRFINLNFNVQDIVASYIITEDAGFGYQCTDYVFTKYGYTVLPANGNCTFIKALRKTPEGSVVIINSGLSGVDSALLPLLRSKEYLSRNVYFTQYPSLEAVLLQHPELTAYTGLSDDLIFSSSSVEGLYTDLFKLALKKTFGSAMLKDYDKKKDENLLHLLFDSYSDSWFYPEISRTPSKERLIP